MCACEEKKEEEDPEEEEIGETPEEEEEEIGESVLKLKPLPRRQLQRASRTPRPDVRAAEGLGEFKIVL